MDNKYVKKIILSNQRRFLFSNNFNENKLKEHLLYKTIIDLPILPDLAASLEEELIRRSIFGTAAIEGNPLNEEQVAEIIKSNKNLGSTKRAIKEIVNLKNTYSLIDNMAFNEKKFIINESNVLVIHQTITEGIDYNRNFPGKYRNHEVKVGNKEHGRIYTPPKFKKDIMNLMNELIRWLNSDDLLNLDPIMRAALAHYHLALIHPFGDGNGRTARAVEAYILRFSNIKYIPLMLSNYYYKNIEDYYWAFSKTIKSKNFEVTEFLLFVMNGIVESLHEIKDKITFFIRKFTLKDYYSFLIENKQISKRQYELLELLLNTSINFSLNDLVMTSPLKLIYNKVSDRTIRRDIHGLVLKNLLIKSGESKYELNWGHLG